METADALAMALSTTSVLLSFVASSSTGVAAGFDIALHGNVSLETSAIMRGTTYTLLSVSSTSFAAPLAALTAGCAGQLLSCSCGKRTVSKASFHTGPSMRG